MRCKVFDKWFYTYFVSMGTLKGFATYPHETQNQARVSKIQQNKRRPLFYKVMERQKLDFQLKCCWRNISLNPLTNELTGNGKPSGGSKFLSMTKALFGKNVKQLTHFFYNMKSFWDVEYVLEEKASRSVIALSNQ